MIMLKKFIEHHLLPDEFSETAIQYYQPFADKIFELSTLQNKPYFIGINGCQGSGKSTLTDYLLEYLTTKYQLNVVVMSLDDFYYSSEKRHQLSLDIHPLLATRGVPGTHNVSALKKVLSQLKQQETGFSIPKFNKATDEPFPQENWDVIKQPVDIVILEGWCWGVKPQSGDQLIEPINELELKHDPKAIWRSYVNNQLIQSYQPLYQEMDFWLALQAPSFDCVYKWRLEQELKLAEKNKQLANSKVMTPAQVLNFTQYFQRLSVQGCKTISHSADATFYLNYDRTIGETSLMEPA